MLSNQRFFGLCLNPFQGFTLADLLLVKIITQWPSSKWEKHPSLYRIRRFDGDGVFAGGNMYDPRELGCEFWITTQFEDFLIEPICALQPQSELSSSVRSATVIALLDAFGPNLRAKVVFSQVMSLLLLWHRNIHPNQPLMYKYDKYAAVEMRSFQMVHRWKTWRSKHLAQGCHVAGAPHRLCEWHHWRCWGGKSCHEQIHGIQKV